MKTVAGLFESHDTADQAYDALKAAGFSSDEISVASRESGQTQVVGGQPQGAEAKAESAHVEAGAFGFAGAATGSVLGLLAGLGALAIPGIGPILAAGALGTALAGAAGGAAVGGLAGSLVGGLTGQGIVEEDARVYAEGVKRGGVLITVQTSDDRAAEAQRILNTGAFDIQANRSTFAFDERTLPDEQYPRIRAVNTAASDNLSARPGQQQATTPDINTGVAGGLVADFPANPGTATTTATGTGSAVVSGGAQHDAPTQPLGTQQARVVHAPEASENVAHEYEDAASGTGRAVTSIGDDTPATEGGIGKLRP